MSVNKNIRIYRKEKNLSTYDVAKLIGISQSAVARYENGTISFVPLHILEKMADIFGCKLKDLTEGDSRYSQSKRKNVSPKSFTVEEQNLIYQYRKLPLQAQNTIKEICGWHISIDN